MGKDLCLEMKGIDKRVLGVHALKAVDFSLEYGEVCGLLGENGAGKSTLMKMLGGIEQMGSGEIYIAGKRAAIHTPMDSQRLGVAFIHQELSLFPDLDIATNTIKSQGQRKFTIMFKQGGQIEYVKESQLDGRMKEILPPELARYFFFDGERITVMSKRLSQGKGDEFARAVRSLLGLDAFTATIEHLKKRLRTTISNMMHMVTARLPIITSKLHSLMLKLKTLTSDWKKSTVRKRTLLKKLASFRCKLKRTKQVLSLPKRKSD